MIILGAPFQQQLSWPLRTVRLLGLIVLIVNIARVDPRPGWQGQGLAVAITLSLATAGWPLWLASDWLPRYALTIAWVLIGVPGGVLAGLSPHSGAIAFPAVALTDAGARLAHRRMFALGVACTAGVLAGHLAAGWGFAVPHLLLLFACALLGTLRWQYVQRAEQSELLLSNAEYAAQEHARAATLAERTRIAREIHDILAHSLAALSVQLKAIDALVEDDAGADRIRPWVSRAEQLANEGIVETRRAILALRGETLPLEQLLVGIIGVYREQDGAAAEFRAVGDPVELPADITMTLYRTAQEALTNVRKHAPGSRVETELRYRPGEVELTVVNRVPEPVGAPAGGDQGVAGLAERGTGYGLAGMRERAEVVGGLLDAGPHKDSWRVHLRIPL
ncbi:sensor histidine kinase [Streptomyces sp. SLBN-8D4]|uniref:sensor histidine kinase n=1 Tax=Streptomyces sp. SLBN-8D4 TaxID=3377728 RepID=UPI003C7B12B2